MSIAVVDAAGNQSTHHWGYRDRDEKLQVDDETVYRVGSVSKLFTDMLAVMLVEEGKLDLDTDVRTYLPDFAPRNDYDVPITLRLLMSHRSGLVREPPVGHYFDPTEPTLAETVDSLNGTALVYAPGSRTKYSNAAIAVVGRIVEAVAGQPFEQYAQQKLLQPLGMEHSSFEQKRVVARHLADAWMRAPHKANFEAPTFALGTSPAGNLYASAADIGRFLSMVLSRGNLEGKQVVPRTVIEQMLQVVSNDRSDKHIYGLGFRIGDLEGKKTVGHGGAVYGFSTQVAGIPEDGVGVIAVTAMDTANGFTRRVCDYALELVLAERAGNALPDFPETLPLPTDLAYQLEGDYEADGEAMELTAYEGKLWMRKGYERRSLRLKHNAGDATLLVADDLEGLGETIELLPDDNLMQGGKTYERKDDAAPAACPKDLNEFIGEYGWDHNTLYIYEDRGQLWALIEWIFYYPLERVGDDTFAFPDSDGLYFGEQLVFERDSTGQVNAVDAANVQFKRRAVGLPSGEVFRIKPARPVEELRMDALAASPPDEPRDFRPSNLVQLKEVEPEIKLDIRYASDRNFMGTPFYTLPRAYMQLPAAEATARAHRALRDKGYGLLIHDAYRPWMVTRMFWDGTPPDLRDFVADPRKGSRHNRGCAVDLTLFDRKTGEPIQMVANYDEFSERSFPLYPGGTRRERWHRDLLRQTMRAQGFSVYEFEWWHFDHRLWQEYPIGNASFEELEASRK